MGPMTVDPYVTVRRAKVKSMPQYLVQGTIVVWAVPGPCPDIVCMLSPTLHVKNLSNRVASKLGHSRPSFFNRGLFCSSLALPSSLGVS